MGNASRALLSSFLMMGEMAGMDREKKYVPSEKEVARKKRESDIAIAKSRGQKEFFYGEETVWAINQKTADKKAKKLGYKL